MADAAVTALIGSRMHPLLLPQNSTYPAASYQLISDSDEDTRTHSDRVGDSRLTRPRIQVDSWAKTYLEAKDLARKIKDAVAGFIGTMGTLEVRGVWLDRMSDDYEDDSETYRVSQDYVLWYTEG